MRRIAIFVSVVALAATSAAAARAQGGLPVPVLFRIATKLTAVQARTAPKVVVLSPAALRRRATLQLRARYPAATVAYDTALYGALGILGPAQPLLPLLQAAWLRADAPVVDVAHRTVYVAAGQSARGAALAGLVDYLYAWRYGLRAVVPGDSDASLALQAALEGATDLAVRDLRQTTAVAPPSSLAGAFLGIESQFVDAVGLRLASNLLNVGGNRAVASLLQRPPISTEQVLHIDKYLERRPPLPMELPVGPAGFTLVRDDTWGELDTRALLAVFQVPRLDQVGTGWGGGMSALYRDGAGRQAAVLRLDWDSPLDAAEWTEAVGTYVNEAFDANVPGPPATTPCAAQACWNVGGRSIAFAADGARTALVVGPSVDAAAQLATALTG